jgi:RHS repeat-associated protein
MMRLRVPSSAVPTTYTIDTYVHIDPLVVGNIRTEHTTGGSSETLLYHALSPEGLPVTGWSFNRTTFATSEVYRAQYTPFGRRTSLTGSADLIPPQRFPGQLEIPTSAAQWWTGTTLVTSREPLVLNRWRVYYPRLGQYLQPEPLLLLGDSWAREQHAYAYVGLGPLDRADPTGREWYPRYYPSGPFYYFYSYFFSVFPSYDDHRTRNRRNCCPSREGGIGPGERHEYYDTRFGSIDFWTGLNVSMTMMATLFLERARSILSRILSLRATP